MRLGDKFRIGVHGAPIYEAMSILSGGEIIGKCATDNALTYVNIKYTIPVDLNVDSGLKIPHNKEGKQEVDI